MNSLTIFHHFRYLQERGGGQWSTAHIRPDDAPEFSRIQPVWEYRRTANGITEFWWTEQSRRGSNG